MVPESEPSNRQSPIRVLEGKVPLRQHRPEPSQLRFTGPNEGWPPRPADQIEVKTIQSSDIPGLPGDRQIEEITEAASRHERVRAALGERYAHLHTDPLAFGKGQERQTVEQLMTRVLFYSYTHRLAVEVTTRGQHVVEVAALRGMQPAEGWAEVQAAIEMARRDERLKERVADLDGHGILLPLSEEQGRDQARLLWVTFTELSDSDKELPALHAAIVDLVAQKVVVVRTDLATIGAVNHA